MLGSDHKFDRGLRKLIFEDQRISLFHVENDRVAQGGCFDKQVEILERETTLDDLHVFQFHLHARRRFADDRFLIGEISGTTQDQVRPVALDLDSLRQLEHIATNPLEIDRRDGDDRFELEFRNTALVVIDIQQLEFETRLFVFVGVLKLDTQFVRLVTGDVKDDGIVRGRGLDEFV